MELFFRRNAQDWSMKRWSTMSIVMKHFGAHAVKAQAVREREKKESKARKEALAAGCSPIQLQ